MARLPRDPAEAVGALGIRPGANVLAVGPDHGYVEALANAVGAEGKVNVQAPPPDLEVPQGVEVVEAPDADAKYDTLVGWVGVVPVHGVRDLGTHVVDDGVLWLVLPKVDRDERASVTEGDVKRAMLSAGWKEERVMPLSTDAFAARFRRRR
ncbi:MAG: hypothetical protein ACRDKJ_11610 [Actinomycetota bacterium]